MTKVIALIFFTLLGITFASGRAGIVGGDPKTWSPAVVDDCEPCNVSQGGYEPDDFVEVSCEEICPKKRKNFLWFW